MTMSERDPRVRARARVGRERLDRLEWLLGFIQSKALRDLSALGLEELRQEISIFARDAGYITIDVDKPMTREDLADLARVVGGGIRNFLAGKSWTVSSDDLGEFTQTLTGRQSKSRGPSPKPGETPVHAWCGEPRAAFLQACFDLVKTEGQQRIRVCDLADCRRLFAVVKRQSFCSVRCSGRARTTRWITNQPKEKLSKLRKERYKRGKLDGY